MRKVNVPSVFIKRQPDSTPGAAIQSAELIPCWHCGKACEPNELELVPTNDTGAKYDYEIKQVLVCKGVEGSLDSPCSEREAAREDRERQRVEEVARLAADLTASEAVRVKAEGEMAGAMALLNPACAEETLEGAIRNLQQAHMTERENADEGERLLSEAQAALTAATWQTIESAPKDGKGILLLSSAYVDEIQGEEFSHPPKVAIGYWNAEGTSWVPDGCPDEDSSYTLDVTGVWNSGGGWFQPNEITHWQSLPVVALVEGEAKDATDD